MQLIVVGGRSYRENLEYRLAIDAGVVTSDDVDYLRSFCAVRDQLKRTFPDANNDMIYTRIWEQIGLAKSVPAQDAEEKWFELMGKVINCSLARERLIYAVSHEHRE